MNSNAPTRRSTLSTLARWLTLGVPLLLPIGCGATGAGEGDEADASLGTVTAAITDPDITADRAAVYDPQHDELLFDQPGSPPEAAMGSTAKIMTVHVALEAVKAGHVNLFDKLTISDKAAAQGCNCFDGKDGTLVGGDQMRLDDALYAVAQSAGEPTVAVAEFVAKAVLDGSKEPNTTWEESAAWEESFVGLMNEAASDLGLVDTVFTTPHGGDDPDQYTTAVELIETWEQGVAANTKFLEFLGPFRRNLAVYKGGSAVATFFLSQRSFGFYPGVEGSKPGGSDFCESCYITSAKRLGRRITVSNLQSSANTLDAAEQLRFGFETIFDPDLVTAAAGAGAITDHALACSGNSAYSAMITPAGTLTLKRWSTDADAGTLTNTATWATGSALTAVDIDPVTPQIFATIERRPTGSAGGAPIVELRTWSWNASVPVPLDVENLGLGGSVVRVVKLAGNRILTAHTTAAGARLRTWSMTPGGVLAPLGTRDYAGAVTELDVAGNVTGGEVVAAFSDGGNLRVRAYSVDPVTGVMTQKSSWSGGAMTSLRVTYIGNGWYGDASPTIDDEYTERYALGYVKADGDNQVAYMKTNLGVLGWIGGWGGAGATASETAVTRIQSSGAVSAFRGATGFLYMAVSDFPWSQPSHSVDEHRMVAYSTVGGAVATQIETCTVNSAAFAGAQLVGVRTGAGQLAVSLWRQGPL